jgi:phosphoribosylamine-glycine ligase
LVNIGPEEPLADGIVDYLENIGILCFGPIQQAAQIEASKAFAKNFMQRHGIPTAQFKSFTEPSEAKDHIQKLSCFPLKISVFN